MVANLFKAISLEVCCKYSLLISGNAFIQLLLAGSENIYVRVFEERMDLLRAAIVGAPGTPYHDGLFFFDICFPPDYPNEPPVRIFQLTFLLYYFLHELCIEGLLFSILHPCLSI